MGDYFIDHERRIPSLNNQDARGIYIYKAFTTQLYYRLYWNQQTRIPKQPGFNFPHLDEVVAFLQLVIIGITRIFVWIHEATNVPQTCFSSRHFQVMSFFSRSLRDSVKPWIKKNMVRWFRFIRYLFLFLVPQFPEKVVTKPWRGWDPQRGEVSKHFSLTSRSKSSSLSGHSKFFFFATLAKNSSFFVNKTFAGKKQPDEEIGIEIIDGNMLRNFS